MTINSLQVFLTVTEEMNFTKAAQRLMITQQSLSGHIHRLEEEYGVTLFERKPRLRLTAEGEHMAFYAGQILRMQREMISEFADLSTQRTADLNLGISYMRSSVFATTIWKHFHADHPNISLHLLESNTNTLLERLQSGDIPIMIGVDIRPIPGLDVMPLMQESMCCLVDRQIYARHCGKDEDEIRKIRPGTPISLQELGSLPVMLPPAGNRLRIALERLFRNAGLRQKIYMESDRQDVLYELVREGEGAGILSPMVLYDAERNRIEVPDNCLLFRIPQAGLSTVSAAVQEDAQLPRYAGEMLRVIVRVFSDYEAAIGRLGLAGSPVRNSWEAEKTPVDNC